MSKVVIYDPPRRGLPYLVVTLSEDAAEAVPTTSKTKARLLALELQGDETPNKHSKVPKSV